MYLPVHQVLPELEMIAEDANHHALSAQVQQITAPTVWILSLSTEKLEGVNKAPPAITANTKWRMENVKDFAQQDFI